MHPPQQTAGGARLHGGRSHGQQCFNFYIIFLTDGQATGAQGTHYTFYSPLLKQSLFFLRVRILESIDL